jgi:hypothetical protein
MRVLGVVVPTAFCTDYFIAIGHLDYTLWSACSIRVKPKENQEITIKYTPEVKQLLKASGMTDAEIKTAEVRDNETSRRMATVKPEDIEPLPEKYSDAALQPMASRPGR